MTAEEFRRIALSFPEATQAAHMGHPDFRVRGKIFATLWPDEEWGMVKLTPMQQELFVEAHPEIFVPVQGGWGRRGATRLRLRVAKKDVTWEALAAAWRNTAPKHLSEKVKLR